MRPLSDYAPHERLPTCLAIYLFTRQYPQLASSPIANWRPGHEIQINIDSTGLTRTDSGKAFVDADGIVCRVIRIPHRDGTFKNPWIKAGATKYWDLIGTSGWDWKEKVSHWVGFDFDSTDGHKNGLSEDQLDATVDAIKSLPYVTLRTSKSGNGYHALVPFEKPVKCPTRADQGRISQYVLDRMSTDAGFDFTKTVDVGGKILWHWSRNTSNGLQTIQTAV